MILSKRPDIDRFLAAPPRGVRAAVIWGKDRSGVRERADKLAASVTDRPDDPFDTSLLTETDIEAGDGRLEEELSALSMAGGRRLVRLRLTGDRAGPEKVAAEALAAHAEGALNPDCFFIVEAGALEKSSALRKAAEKPDTCVSIPIYDDEAGDITRMVRDALTADKVSLTPEALQVFVSRLPKERGVARQEVERLALYIGPGSNVALTLTELSGFLGVEPEASLQDAAQDAFGGRSGPAHDAIRRARAEGEGGPATVRALSQHLQKLRRAQALQSKGADPQAAAKQVGVFWKNEREFLRQLRAWSPGVLETLQPELFEADVACKTTGSPDALIAERLALSIAARAKRLGL